MAHNHPVIDSDLHFTINPFTREIINPSGKAKVMQYDHQSERFTFEISRYIEGHDMLLCDIVEVHYTNSDSSNKSTGVYLINDLHTKTDDEETIVFSWLISGNATKYSGKLDFSIRFACSNDENIDYAWNTEIFSDISVGKAINNTTSVEGIEPDFIASFRDEMNKFNTSLNLLNSQMKNVINNTNTLSIYCEYIEGSTSNMRIVSADDSYFGAITLKDSSNKDDYSELIRAISLRHECGGAIKVYVHGDSYYFDVRPYGVTEYGMELVAPDFTYGFINEDGQGEPTITAASYVQVILNKSNAIVMHVEF